MIYFSSPFSILIAYLLRDLKNGISKDYAMEMINDCTYPAEIHSNIETPDGYLLTMQRIPHGRNDSGDKQRTPVLLMHGILGSAEHFLLMGCKMSLAYLLADEGYDVWLGNVRSVSYSRHHVTLDPNDKTNWNFSFDEFATYDLPTFIDYVLNKTDHQQLMYIGHSQGTLNLYLMCSNKPGFANKVSLFINLSPVASLTDMPHPWLPTVCYFEKTLNALSQYFGLLEWTFVRDLIREYGWNMCSGIFKPVCKFIIYFVTGMSPSKIHDKDLRRVLKNCPEGISSLQFFQGCQMHNKRKLVKFDYGDNNEDIPEYFLKRMTVPTALYFSASDWFLALSEVDQITAQLPNIIDYYQIPDTDFSHLDFLIGHSAPKVLYGRVLNLMNSFQKFNITTSAKQCMQLK